MAENKENNLPVQGAVEIHESVIAAITRKAVSGVEGVIRLSGSSFIDNIAEMVGSRRTSFDKAIVITLAPDSVAIEVRIIVQEGFNVAEVASEAQNAVLSAVTEQTGMTISKADIIVMDIEAPAEVSSGEEAETEE